MGLAVTDADALSKLAEAAEILAKAVNDLTDVVESHTNSLNEQSERADELEARIQIAEQRMGYHTADPLELFQPRQLH